MFLARIPTITRGSSPTRTPPAAAASGGSESEASVGSAEHWSTSVDVRRRKAQTERRVSLRGVLGVMAGREASSEA